MSACLASSCLTVPVLCCWFCCVILLISSGTLADDEFDGAIALQLQHSFDSGANAEFVPRRTVTFQSLKSISTHLPSSSSVAVEEPALTGEQQTKLAYLARTGGIYRIRAPIKTADTSRVTYLSSFVEACALYESSLSDVLTIHTDASGQPVGVSISTAKQRCDGLSSVPLSHLMHFNTTLVVQPIDNGPSPDTSAYIQKVDREKAEKAKGEQGDNRSFFAKYWMYIVPVFIFIFISGIANPEGGGGGR